jgi:hypothetical protein
MCFHHASSSVFNKIPQCKEDRLLPGNRKGYPAVNYNVVTTVRQIRDFDPLTCSHDGNAGSLRSADNAHITYNWTSRMLSVAAETLVALKGRVKVELICAELFSELQLMRNGEDHHRPKDFPRSFLRVWTSNIP